MTAAWALQDAKARLSEVVKLAQQEEPQWISVRGKPAVVVVSQAMYLQLVSPKMSLIDFLQQSPLAELDLTRDKSVDRESDL